MASAGSLIFELAADVSRLRTDMAKSQSIIQASLDSIAKSSAATAVMAGADWAMAFAKGFADKIKSAIDEADALGKLAQRIGTTTSELSALKYAGSFAGVSMDDLTTAFKGMEKSLLEARNPLSDSAAAFRALGLNIKQLQSMDPGRAFETIAGAFSQFSDGAEKAAVATQLFGKQGQALIPLLNGGAQGIAQAREEAEKLGLIVSSQTAQAMSDLNDDFTRIGNLSQGAASVMATELQPAISEVARILVEASTQGTVWNDVLHGITSACKQAMSIVVGLTGTIAAFGKVTSALGQALNQDASFEGMKRAAGIVSDAWNQARDDLTKVHDAQQRITRSASESEKAVRAEGAAAKAIDGKPVLQFTRNLDENAAAAKRAAKGVDEYAKFLEDIRKKTIALTSHGNPLAELMDDPKFKKLSADRQQNLINETTAFMDKQQAMALDKQATDDLAKSQVDAANAQAAWNKSLEDYTSTQLDALDPMRENAREMAKIGAALESNIVTQDEYNKLVEQSSGKLHKSLEQQREDANQLSPQFKSLQQAIEGFGKQSSDALVDFAFATKDVSVSFNQMIASILKDMAKMLVYQNVMKPLFAMIGSGVTGGGWTWGGVASAAGRMAGGPVSPGSLYEVNELPGRKEFFIPNVPGKVVSDAGMASNGSNVTVNVHVHRDETATQDTKATDEQAAALGNRIASVVRQVLVAEKRTGGILAATR